MDGTTVLTASSDGSGVRGTVFCTHLDTHTSECLAELAVNRTGDLATAGDGRIYLLADVRGNDIEPRPLVIQLGRYGCPA